MPKSAGLIKQAQVLQQQSRCEQAETLLRKLLKAQLDHADALYQLALLKTDTGAFAEAQYFAASAPERAVHYRSRLGLGFKVALSWRSIRTGRLGSSKSVGLKEFAPLFAVPGGGGAMGRCAVRRYACGASGYRIDARDAPRTL